MKHTADGRAIIPSDRCDLLSHLAEDDEDTRFLSPTRHECGDIAGLAWADEIAENVTSNISLARSEAAWNGNVHTPLLDKAWRLSALGTSTPWENIRPAMIEPIRLLPESTSGDPLSSKEANFRITVVFSKDIEIALARCGVDPLSQSTYEPLRFSPLAVSFETKLPGESWSEANRQLNTWVLAQVRELKELLQKAGRPDAQIPALPVVLAQGEEWKFLYLQVQPRSAAMWSSVPIGQVGSARGVYHVTAALQRLIEWSHKVYQPSFLENIDCEDSFEYFYRRTTGETDSSFNQCHNILSRFFILIRFGPPTPLTPRLPYLLRRSAL